MDLAEGRASHIVAGGADTMRHTLRPFTLLVAVSLAGTALGCAAVQVHSKPGTTTTVILTRHADRDEGAAELNATGIERAKALVEAVSHLGVTAIYSPDVERNLATVRPLARRLGIEITLTPAVSVWAAGSIVDEILDKHAGGVVVWVGNVSGNLQAMYHRLGGTGSSPVEYGDLRILTIPDKGPVTVVKTRYGP
jgi:hypothetical protein